MSEFKYACPHCGQHIRCDAAQAGMTMECPTCFQKIVAPQTPVSHDTKLILAGSKLPKQLRPAGAPGLETARPAAPAKKFPAAAIVAVILIAGAVVTAVVFRGKILRSAGPPSASRKSEAPPAPPSVSRPGWKLNLNAAVLPGTPAAGRIGGKDFTCQRALLLGGILNLRQGSEWPPVLGVSIALPANRSGDLAGKIISITTNSLVSPRVVLRWKDDRQQVVTRNFTGGYAVRIEFGQLAGDRLPGEIYLVTPDEQKSFVAGSFTADIVKPKRKP